MTLLVILAFVFSGVALMVFFGEKHGKPMTTQTQSRYAKWSWILVFSLLFIALIKAMMESLLH